MVAKGGLYSRESAYSKISPLPSLEVMSTAEKGGAYFREDTVLRVTRKSIKWTWAEPFEMNVKIEQELNFVVDNDRRLFLDAQKLKR